MEEVIQMVQERVHHGGRRRRDVEERFELFGELGPLLPEDEELRQRVRMHMHLLSDKWRDNLCRAVIEFLRTGKKKRYTTSLVMKGMMKTAMELIKN